MTTPSPAADTAAETTLRLVRRLDAPPAVVFRAWTDPAALARWWGPQGCTVPHCEIDPRPGGAWRTCMRSAEGNDNWVHGTYREVVAPARLVFTWVWEQGEMAGVETVVTVALRPDGDGTELTLVHEGLPSADWRELHGKGWTSSLDCLERETGR